jgi:hypothetical protein
MVNNFFNKNRGEIYIWLVGQAKQCTLSKHLDGPKDTEMRLRSIPFKRLDVGNSCMEKWGGGGLPLEQTLGQTERHRNATMVSTPQ